MNSFELKVSKELLQTCKIIGIALPVSAIIFLGIAVGQMLMNNQEFKQELDVFSIILLIQFVTLVPAIAIVPWMSSKSMAREQLLDVDIKQEIEKELNSDSSIPPYHGKLIAIFQTYMIIGSAIAEGVGIFGGMVVIMEQSIYGAIISGIMILILFFRIPTESKIQNFMIRMIEYLDHHRRTGPHD